MSGIRLQSRCKMAGVATAALFFAMMVARMVVGQERCDNCVTGERIAGGADAPRERYLYMVSIRQVQRTHLCQGVLIAPRFVLTVASCVSPLRFPNPAILEAYIGGVHVDPSRDDTSRKELKPVRRIIPHPNFIQAGSQGVNLAVLELHEDSTLPPIQLPRGERGCCEDGTLLRVLGWGSVSAALQFASRLQVGQVTYIPRERCQRDFQVPDLNSVSVCAGGGSFGATLCDGDAGTPLILTDDADDGQDLLIGIGSPNPLAECRSIPAEFIRIAFFMNWIAEHVPDV